MDVVLPNLPDDGEDARKTGRTSARLARVEVLAHAERRRSWSLDQKREIVGESLGPELTPTEVARKYRISTGQLYTWRHQLLEMQGRVPPAAPRFASVELGAPHLPSSTSVSGPTLSAAASMARPEGLIEIQLPTGVRLRVDAHVDGHALRRILKALADR